MWLLVFAHLFESSRIRKGARFMRMINAFSMVSRFGLLRAAFILWAPG
jgi:hypothetical protein